jgi:hypothetical protein
VGVLLLLAGLSILGYVVLAWRAAGYGALMMIREMVTASTLLVIGLQTMFGGFLLSVIGGNEARVAQAAERNLPGVNPRQRRGTPR